MEYKIPKRLLESKKQILRGFSSKAPTAYVAGGWQKHFKGDSDFAQISQEFPTSIRRIDLEGLSRQLRNGGYTQIRKLFLASMIWGYVKDDLRGAWRTKQMLSYPGADEMLEKAARWISNGQIVEACKGFTLPWCGSVFSTKFFYFIGLGAGISPLPCILDDRVAQSLEQLGREEGWDLPVFDNVYGKGIRRCPEGYIQYIRSLGKWAKELGCRADYIEYFMYLKGKQGIGTREYLKEESMKKARGRNWKWLKEADTFSATHGLTTESEMIKDMEWPASWNLPKGGNGGRPWWWFVRAVRGNYIRMWEWKGINALPAGWGKHGQGYRNTRKQVLDEYLKEPEGTAWQKRHKPGWLQLPVSTGPLEEAVIQVPLPEDELEKLKEKANKFGVDPSTLARIWILERLS